MYRVELNIEVQHLAILLTFLDKLGTGQELIRIVPTPSVEEHHLLPHLPIDDPLRQWLKPLRPQLCAEDFIRPHFQQGINRERLDFLFQQLQIEEPIERLLEDLKN